MSKPISTVAISSFSRIVLVRTSVLGLNNSLQTIIPLSSIFPSFHKRSTRKITKNCLTGGFKTWLERMPSFSQRKCIKKELLSVSNLFSLRDEVIHFGELGIYWGKYTEAEYLKTSYHKQLIKEDFYRQITI